ncbi:MAG: hypothetical protein RLZZ528_1748 [Pseudomonadota bacterium]
MKDAPRKETLASRIAADLRQSILSGDLAPGSRINLDHLRLRFGTSISPLREALARLTADGLVLFEDQRGFRVAPVSATDFADIADLRRDLHAKALAGAMASAGIEWEAGLVRTLHLLSRSPATPLSQAVFLAALARGCDRPVLIDLCARSASLASRYLGLAGFAPGTPQDLHEMEGIVRAATARQVEAALTALHRHLSRTDATIAARLFPGP